MGESDIRSVAWFVFGKAITSRIDSTPQSMAQIRSKPNAIPPWGGAPAWSAPSTISQAAGPSAAPHQLPTAVSVPEEVLQLCIPDVSDMPALIAHRRIAAVNFTGGTAAAESIDAQIVVNAAGIDSGRRGPNRPQRRRAEIGVAPRAIERFGVALDAVGLDELGGENRPRPVVAALVSMELVHGPTLAVVADGAAELVEGVRVHGRMGPQRLFVGFEVRIADGRVTGATAVHPQPPELLDDVPGKFFVT